MAFLFVDRWKKPKAKVEQHRPRVWAEGLNSVSTMRTHGTRRPRFQVVFSW